MRLLLAALCAAQGLHGQLYEVLKSADIDAGLRNLQASTILYRGSGYTVSLESRSAGANLTDDDASQILSIRGGTGVIRLGLYRHNIGAGDMVRIGRRYGCQLESGQISFVLLRMLPGSGPKNVWPLLPAVLRASEMVAAAESGGELPHGMEKHIAFDEEFAETYLFCESNCPPWHLHQDQAQIYFVQSGTAIIGLGGQLVDEFAAGFRSYAVGPGDVLMIPANTPHSVDNRGKGFSYLLAAIFVK